MQSDNFTGQLTSVADDPVGGVRQVDAGWVDDLEGAGVVDDLHLLSVFNVLVGRGAAGRTGNPRAPDLLAIPRVRWHAQKRPKRRQA